MRWAKREMTVAGGRVGVARDRQIGRLLSAIPTLFVVTLATFLILWLMPGDIIMTGTPAGVGAVVSGDVLDCSMDGVQPMQVRIGPKAA